MPEGQEQRKTSRRTAASNGTTPTGDTPAKATIAPIEQLEAIQRQLNRHEGETTATVDALVIRIHHVEMAGWAMFASVMALTVLIYVSNRKRGVA